MLISDVSYFSCGILHSTHASNSNDNNGVVSLWVE